MARRSDHTRDELKEMILEASWRIVGEEGFEALSARRVAGEIGYAPGTIYNIFNSMDDLYLQINARTLDRLYGVLSAPACNDSEKTPVENMTKMADLYMDFAQKHRPYWLMLFHHSLPEGRQVLDWYQEKINRLFAPLETLLAPLFDGQQSQRQKMAARALWSAVHGLCFLQGTGKMPLLDNKAQADAMAAYMIETFTAGIEKSEA